MEPPSAVRLTEPRCGGRIASANLLLYGYPAIIRDEFFVGSCRNGQKKKAGRRTFGLYSSFCCSEKSDRSGDLTGTQAACAGVNSAGGAVDDRLDSFHVGLPGSVGSSVGVGNLDTELHVFSAKIAFCHVERTSFDYWTNKSAENIITDSRRNCKLFFDFFGFFSFFLRFVFRKACG